MTKLTDILSLKEEQELKKLIENKAAVNGLRKTFLKCLYYDGTLSEDQNPEPRMNFICQLLYNADMSMDYNIDDTRLGQKTRAVVEGIRLVEQSFRELELLRETPKEEVKEDNPGR